MFTLASPDAISLLEGTLVFNPFYRDSVDKALQHEFFQPIRSSSMETTTHEIDLEFDHVTETEVTLNDLRKIFL
jgi:serine/threonine protein kinase